MQTAPFARQIRSYNSLLSFSSSAMTRDRNRAQGIFHLRVSGEVYTRYGPNQAGDDATPQNHQLYVYDAGQAAEFAAQLPLGRPLVRDTINTLSSVLSAELSDKDRVVVILDRYVAIPHMMELSEKHRFDVDYICTSTLYDSLFQDVRQYLRADVPLAEIQRRVDHKVSRGFPSKIISSSSGNSNSTSSTNSSNSSSSSDAKI
jgi:hypothetical protein